MYIKKSSLPLSQTLNDVKSSLPPSLQAPFMTALRAFGMSWSLTTVPGILSLLIKLCLALIRRHPKNPSSTLLVRQALFNQLPKLLKKSIYENGFPWLVTGALASHSFVAYILKRWEVAMRHHYTTFIKPRFGRSTTTSTTTVTNDHRRRPLFIFLSTALTMFFVKRLFPNNKTMELSLFSMVRAMDVVAHRAYDSALVTRYLPAWVMEYGSVIAFTAACTEIMFAWFYEPSRLPGGYAMWITKVAQMDERLVLALRGIRNGTWVYGKDTGENDLLGNYCLDIGMPYEAGLPTRGRIPCRIVHDGQPWGCEVNALTRFVKGFTKVFLLYFTVHLTPPLLFKRDKLLQHPISSLQHVVNSTVRSSTFLATYITLIWYSVCLTRTRIGHQLLGVDQNRLDHTLGPLIGSAMCGLSLLIENRHRRGEMALYVAPRALFSLTERLIGPWFHRGRWWEPKVAEMTETILFAAAVSTVLNAMYVDKEMVRSSVRGILGWIMKYELAPKDEKTSDKPTN